MDNKPTMSQQIVKLLPMIITIAGLVSATNSESMTGFIVGLAVGLVGIAWLIVRGRKKNPAIGNPRFAIGMLVQTASPAARPIWFIGSIGFLVMGVSALVLFFNDPSPLLFANAMIGIGLTPCFLVPLYPRLAIAITGWFGLCFSIGGGMFVYSGVNELRGVGQEVVAQSESDSDATADSSDQANSEASEKAEPASKVDGLKHISLGALMLLGGIFPLLAIVFRAMGRGKEVKTYIFDEGLYTPRGPVYWSQISRWKIDQQPNGLVLEIDCQGTRFSAEVPREVRAELDALLSLKVPVKADA